MSIGRSAALGAAALAAAIGLSVKAPAHPAAPQRARSGVYYEIFVRSFYDANGDGIGDLDGITAKLGYLQWLGVSGIWLTPINPSPSYHGYDVTDYFAINRAFGTMADFHRLLRAAHARGIKVLMDLELNHTSNVNPWFERAVRPASRYHDWYLWAGPGTDLKAVSSVGIPAWHRIDGEHYLGEYGRGMPALNYDDPAVRAEMIKVARFWLRQGVDGFRLADTTLAYVRFESQRGSRRAIARNIAWWGAFHAALRRTDPSVQLLGEVPASRESQVAPYYSALDSMFDYPLARRLIASAASERSANLGSYLERSLALFRAAAHGPIADAPFLGNHDQSRVIDQLDDNVNHMRMAAAMLLTLPGDPFIYYGEEIGMHGVKPDTRIREPMRWDRSIHARGETTWEAPLDNESPQVSVAAERGDPNSLLELYRTLIHWRIELPALRDGGIAPYPADGGPICAYVRSGRGQRLLIVQNLSAEPRIVMLTAGSFHEVIRRTRAGIQLQGRRLTMPGYSTAILE